MRYKLIASLLFYSLFVCGQSSVLSAVQKAEINAIIEDELLKQEVFGMSIGIVVDGKIVYTQGYGHKDEKRQIPVSTSTVFNWASISKILTAVATFQLIEDKLLSKSTKVKPVLKNIWTNKEDKNEITVGHLLSHRSGLRHYNLSKGDDIEADFSLYTDTSIRSDWNSNQCVAIFNDLKLMSKPDSMFRYSTFGYNLLGAVIDRVSKDGYVGHITKNIIGPLDTKSLNIARRPWQAFYKDCLGAVYPWLEDEKRSVLPGGGWQSNISDMTVFMNALINNQLLKNTSSLWADVVKNGEILDNSAYRFGLRSLIDTVNLERIVLHSGKHENVRTIMAFFPESKLGFCIMMNGGYADEFRVFRRLASYFGKEQNEYQGPCMRCESHSDCPGELTGIWHNGMENSLVRFGYSVDRFEKEIGHLKARGYDIYDVEYFMDDSRLLAHGTFVKSNKTAIYIPPKDVSSFYKQYKSNLSNGYDLIDIEVFMKDEKVYWSGILKKGASRVEIIRDFHEGSFRSKILRMKRQGYTPIDIESYEFQGKQKWCALLVSGTENDIVLSKSLEEFKIAQNEQTQFNRKLHDLEIYKVGNDLFYSGVFQPLTSPVELRSRRNYCEISKLFTRNAQEAQILHDLERPF